MGKSAHHLSSDRYSGFLFTLCETYHNPTVSHEAKKISFEENTDNEV